MTDLTDLQPAEKALLEWLRHNSKNLTWVAEGRANGLLLVAASAVINGRRHTVRSAVPLGNLNDVRNFPLVRSQVIHQLTEEVFLP